MENMYNVAVKVLKMLGVTDMEIVISNQFGCQFSRMLSHSYNLLLPDNEVNALYNAYLTLELIEELYGIKIESDFGALVFGIAHEIGHYMKISKHKSNLERLGYILAGIEHTEAINIESDKIEELQAQYDKEYKEYKAESDNTHKLIKESIASGKMGILSECNKRLEAESKRREELNNIRKEIKQRKHDNDIAYRLMPEEVFADKFAIEFIKANFPELIVG
jgi:hypothetical protein